MVIHLTVAWLVLHTLIQTAVTTVDTLRVGKMRVSEADLDEHQQCNADDSGNQSQWPLAAVCRPRTRCSLEKLMQPVRLCRLSSRTVFGRALQLDDSWRTLISRAGYDGVCCRLDGPATTTRRPATANKGVSLGRRPAAVGPDQDLLDIIPYASLLASQLLYQNSNRVRSPEGALVSAKKSFTAANIEDLGLDCGRRNLSYKMMRLGRIVGGITAGFSDWPWVVMVLNYGRPRCGGTLLSNSTVITAAHCVSGSLLLYNLTVRVGMFNTNERLTLPFPPVERRVVNIVRHPEFDLTTLLNDVAVLHLAEPVTFAPNIMPACLASQEYPPTTPTIILGWGKEGENNSVYELPDSLQAVSVPVYNRSDCAVYFNKQGLINLIGPQHICAGSDEGGRDACQGDSGGPMLLANPEGRFELLGIISWGFGCGEPHIPAVYTNIFYFKKWIIQTVKSVMSGGNGRPDKGLS